jgi:hypothetical protein
VTAVGGIAARSLDAWAVMSWVAGFTHVGGDDRATECKVMELLSYMMDRSPVPWRA